MVSMATKNSTFGYMTQAQADKVQKIATESAALAKRTLRKSNELEAYLGLLEYRKGRINFYGSLKELMQKAKRA